MQNLINNNCVNLSSENQTVYWGNNSPELTLQIQPIIMPPIVTYTEQLHTTGNYSILYYQWCGPFMLIIKELAKRVNAKYIL